MKLIIAYLQPFVAERVLSALHLIPGVTGATIFDARGFGRSQATDRPTPENVFGTSDRLRLEVAVEDDLENNVMSAIATAGRTGRRGDGMVLSVPISGVLRVTTGVPSL